MVAFFRYQALAVSGGGAGPPPRAAVYWIVSVPTLIAISRTCRTTTLPPTIVAHGTRR